MQRPSLPGWPTRLLHVVLIIAGWGVFGWFWWKVLFQQPLETHSLSLLIAAALIISPTITLIWVLHNLGIHTRKGARQTSITIAPSYTRDWMGITVHADFETLKTAPRILIEHLPTGKHYRQPDGASHS